MCTLSSIWPADSTNESEEGSGPLRRGGVGNGYKVPGPMVWKGDQAEAALLYYWGRWKRAPQMGVGMPTHLLAGEGKVAPLFSSCPG